MPDLEQTINNNPLIQQLHKRASVRSFSDEDVPEALVDAILEAARRSPTSSNLQTYSIMVIRDPEKKRQLVPLTGGQEHVAKCPVFLAFCADLSRLTLACKMHDAELAKTLESSLVSSIDAALVGMTTQLLVESFGLGAVMIGAMRNHPREAAKVLELPENVYVVYGMCIGHPQMNESPLKPRLPKELVVHKEQYHQSSANALTGYNRDLADYYNALGKNLADDAWTAPIAKRLQQPSRPELKSELEALGFSLD